MSEKKYKVLLIDDEPYILKLVKEVLESTDEFEVITYPDAENIVEKIKVNSPDIILLDIKLYGISGVEAIRIIKNTPEVKDIPVVAFTSFTMKGDREKFLKMGYDEYIPKPIDTRGFPEQIKKVVEKFK